MTRIPGDLDRPDEFLFGLTARQLALLAPAFVVLALLGWLGAGRVPLPVLLAFEAVGFGMAISVTLVHQDGLTPEALGKALLSYLRRPKQLAWMPEEPVDPPKRLRLGRKGGVPARFVEPWRGFSGRDLDLGDDGWVRVLAVSSLDLQLRSSRETAALTGGFGRLLNGLDESLCVLVRAEPIDLEARAEAVENTAREVDHGGLGTYAADHANFLRSMSGGLRRQVYLVVKGRDPHALDARCEEVLTLLLPMGLAARELDGPEAVALLARATGQPVPDPSQAGPGETVMSEGETNAALS
ncbi:MAG TPA: PrgI family protein [Actinomycetota bacterium]|nr:PrgI family protein [Actinomycetota bacterium]